MFKILCYNTALIKSSRNTIFKSSNCGTYKHKLFVCTYKILHSEPKSVTAEFFNTTLALPKEKSEELLNNSNFRKLTISRATRKINLLKKFRISESCISQNLWILLEPSLQKKLELFNFTNLNENNISLLRINLKELIHISLKCQNDNIDVESYHKKIDYFQNELEIDQVTTIKVLNRYSFVLNRSFDKIEEIMLLLKSSGVDSTAIVKDMWIFRHNINVMKSRISKVKEFNCPIKTWMLRCTDEILDNSLKRWKMKMEILGEDQDLVDYLALRLESDREAIIKMATEKNRRLLSIHPIKVKLILDYLFQQGISIEQVKRNPRVLGSSLKTIQRRMIEIKKYNYFPASLNIFIYKYKFLDTLQKIRDDLYNKNKMENDNKNIEE